MNPSYYEKYNIKLKNGKVLRPYDILAQQNFTLGNIGKYLIRYKDKGQKEDLAKALWYLDNSMNDTLNSGEVMVAMLNLSSINPLTSLYVDLINNPKDMNIINSLKEAINKEIKKTSLDSPLDKLELFTSFIEFTMDDFRDEQVALYNEFLEDSALFNNLIKSNSKDIPTDYLYFRLKQVMVDYIYFVSYKLLDFARLYCLTDAKLLKHYNELDNTRLAISEKYSYEDFSYETYLELIPTMKFIFDNKLYDSNFVYNEEIFRKILTKDFFSGLDTAF